MTANIPVNALDRHIAPIAGRLELVATEVIASGYYVLGPNVKAFEREFAEWCGVRECVSVANGTDALELGLRSLGVTSGKRVAVVANAAMYGTTAVLACGAEPVFVDVDPSTSNMDPAALERVVRSQRIDVVIVTHLYGRLADMATFGRLAETHGFAIMEDCAQAHGARDSSGRKAGSFGMAASFSFYPTKNLGALGDGGAITTNDAATAETLRKLRQYGWSSKYNNEMSGGRNSRLDEMQAAFLRLMLPMLDGWNNRRREIANRYSSGIRNPRINVPAVDNERYVAHLYVVQCDDRAALQAHLAQAGIGSDVHYPVVDYRQPCHGEAYRDVHLPATEALASTILTLPCFPELTDDEVEQVIEACRQF